ncbi:MAG: acyl dehydratase [Acidimicrobiales bacterium]
MTLDGPYFDDFSVGQVLPAAPAITIDEGVAAQYQAICGDALRPSLSLPMAEAITGVDHALVNPALVMHMAIGQSTVATRQVIANLFYRDVRMHKASRVGTTLTTSVTIVALAAASRKAGRTPRGKVLLGIQTIDEQGEVVVDFERCALLPFRDREASPSGQADEIGSAEVDLDLALWHEWVPDDWDLTALGDPTDWQIGETRTDPLRDTVTNAVELVRLTQNQAAIHRDSSRSRNGKRLVYGGHTIGLAQASLTRLLPTAATVIGWHSCDHLAPVYENDVLSFQITLTAEDNTPTGRLLAFAVVVQAHSYGPEGQRGETSTVLDWRPVVLAV